MKKRKIEYITLFLIHFLVSFMVILLALKKHQVIIYVSIPFTSLIVLKSLINNYFSVKKLGLGITRKEMASKMNREYSFDVLKSLFITALLILFDFILYRFDLDIFLCLFLYLLGLALCSSPISFLMIKVVKKRFRITFLVFNLILIGLSIYLYTKETIFYLSYILIVLDMALLFLLRKYGLLIKQKKQ